MAVSTALTVAESVTAVAKAAAGMLISIVLPWLAQWWDRRQLRRQGRDGPWGYASWGSALYGFGPLSMLAWSHLTRARPWRWLMGPAYMGVLLLAIVLVSGDADDTPSDALERLTSYLAIVAVGAVFLLLLDGAQSLWRRLRR